MFKVLTAVQNQLHLWKESQSRVLLQLASLSNLVQQSEASASLTNGSNSSLGVLSQYPMVVQLLQAKLVLAMERALAHIHKEKAVLSGIVQRLKREVKEGQKIFEEHVGLQGLEASCARSAEHFSLCEHLSWLRQLHCAYRSDLEEKLAVLDSLDYTSQSLRHVCVVWENEPLGITGN